MAAEIYAIGQRNRTRHKPQQRRVPTVLVVDDESSVVQMVCEVLEDDNLRVLTARSGQEALAIASRDEPDLIITDLMMPGISGRVLRQQLEAQRRTAKIPVLLMTATYQIQAPDEFAGIIAKPFDIDELLGQVRRHIAAR